MWSVEVLPPILSMNDDTSRTSHLKQYHGTNRAFTAGATLHRYAEGAVQVCRQELRPWTPSLGTRKQHAGDHAQLRTGSQIDWSGAGHHRSPILATPASPPQRSTSSRWESMIYRSYMIGSPARTQSPENREAVVRLHTACRSRVHTCYLHPVADEGFAGHPRVAAV
jgi:hypothetical protein